MHCLRWLRFLPPRGLLRQHKTSAVHSLRGERLLHQLAGFHIHHGDGLLSCMQITAYNFHLGLPRPELFGWIPQSLLGRREADVVMTSAIEIKRRGIGTVDEQLPWSGCRSCSLPAKDARRNRDSAVPDLLCGVSKQQLAVLSEKATQLLQLGGVSILLLFQVP